MQGTEGNPKIRNTHLKAMAALAAWEHDAEAQKGILKASPDWKRNRQPHEADAAVAQQEAFPLSTTT